MSAHPYTLLIVESPTLAKVIDNLQLPAVEVISTKGFVWMPTFNHKTGKVKAIADPLKAELRKLLASKAPWASKVVIATDPDPSGMFIAESIARYLKRVDVFRTHFDFIKKEHVLDRISNAPLFGENDSTLLTRYFRVWEEIQRNIIKNYSLDEILAYSYFNSKQNHSFWLNSVENRFSSDIPLNIKYNHVIHLDATGNATYLHPPSPPSIADILKSIQSSFQKGYEALRRLFETIPEEFIHNLISYPRTASQIWHAETWEHLTDQLRSIHHTENPIPVSMRVISPKNQRNGLYVNDLKCRPHQMRQFLPLDSWKMYEVIYHRTLQSLKTENRTYPIYRSKEYPDVSFLSLDSVSEGSQMVKPAIRQQDFMQALLDTGFIKPSKIAGIMDQLLGKNVILIEDEVIKPGKIMANLSLPGNVNTDSISFLTELHEMTMNQDYRLEDIFSKIRAYNHE